MKNFFSGFIPAFITAIAWPLVNGRGSDTLIEGLTIYLFIPLLLGVIAGFIVLAVKKFKA